MTELDYVGTELELFADAVHWKRYWSALIAPYIGARVLDVGAGTGATARLFGARTFERWLALEPDPALAARIATGCDERVLPGGCEVRTGTLEQLERGEVFDTVLYIDVLEHIQDDVGELARAAAHLTDGGHLVVLAPAHAFLTSPFDHHVGHHRRYDRKGLRGLRPANCVEVRCDYLDSAGLLASLANRLLLRQSLPTPGQIRVWDRVLVRISAVLDPLLRRSLGKSALLVLRKTR